MFAKRKAPTTLASPAVKQSAKAPTKTRIDETRTAVSTTAGGAISSKQPPQSSAAEPIEISSGSSSDDDYDLEEGDSDAEDATSKPKQQQNGVLPSAATPSKTTLTNGDTDMADAPSEDEDDSAQPTLGELYRGSTTVDISTSLQKQTPLPLTKQPQSLVPAPTLSSLGTVLNQALRTDDSELLESCLSTTDLATVRATIERLDSSLAGALLSKLASRMHRRPGRAQSLMTWVQWTLVAHGGALAGRADLLVRLADLNRVLEERSRGLGSLLALKGKLDMLDSQMQLRRESKARRRGEEEGVEDEEGEGEEGMIYVEGEEEEGSKVNGVKRIGGDEDEGLANGIGGDSDGEEDSEEESDDDVDAEPVAGEEDLDEDEVDFDDVEESGDDESEAEVEAPPAKIAKTSKKGRRG
ncbi:NUC189-domain-containing protein [Coniochaeta ligniaria NRRL 30616]|uniref:NUC189-domain-containing protein n=1 Tax=Coniochaeta ligniaria NRRL 30616 TaxID=1408157 RepID=A0A1J7J996_9PEZI|nr:NUC189-domain-containing protein [Coniochaeta ligniaria NRRL 30616]